MREKRDKEDSEPSSEIEGSQTDATVAIGNATVDEISQRTAEILVERSASDHPITIVSQYRGPIPPATEMERLERIHPGTADRIITMAENEQKHVHEMQKQMLVINEKTVWRGQVFGLTIGVVAIVAGAATAMMGQEIAGGFIGTGGVAALVWAFLYRSPQEIESNS